MQSKMIKKNGFTMVEVLVVVMIIAILVTIAVPMYERAVEKSRIAEVETALKRLSESKLRVMDNRDMATFHNDTSLPLNEFLREFLKQLDVALPDSSDFIYSPYPASYPNAVCAVRSRGSNQGTKFLFLGETAPDYCNCASATSGTVCGAYCDSGRRFFCEDASVSNPSCEDYGMSSVGIGTCHLPQ